MMRTRWASWSPPSARREPRHARARLGRRRLLARILVPAGDRELSGLGGVLHRAGEPVPAGISHQWRTRRDPAGERGDERRIRRPVRALAAPAHYAPVDV